MNHHACPEFDVQAPHGAAGALDVPVRRGDVLWVEQSLTESLPDDCAAIRAQLMVDDTVVATSYDGELLPPKRPGAVATLRFQFPSSLQASPQFVGVRYIARLRSSSDWVLMTMHRPSVAPC